MIATIKVSDKSKSQKDIYFTKYILQLYAIINSAITTEIIIVPHLTNY